MASPGEQTPPPGVDNRVVGAVSDALGGVLVFGASRCRAGATDFDGAVWRFTAEGALDPDFGEGGTACVGRVAGDSQQETFYDLTLDPAGRIVVVGKSGSAGLVVRLDARGTPDPTFGPAGGRRVAIALSTWEAPTMSFNAVIVDGARIVIAGANADPFNPNILGFVLALDDHGTLDATFNQGRVWFDPNALGHYALARDADTYLLAGSDRLTRHARVLRFRHDGSLDADFGVDGLALLARPDAFVVQAMVLDEAGRIVLAGALDPDPPTRGPTTPAAVVRLDQHGVLDEAFTNAAATLPVRWNLGYQFRSSLTRQCDGRLLLCGIAPGGVNVERLTTDGTLDPTFGDSGLAFVPNPGPTARSIGAVATVLDPASGRITVVTNEHDSRAIGLWRFSR